MSSDRPFPFMRAVLAAVALLESEGTCATALQISIDLGIPWATASSYGTLCRRAGLLIAGSRGRYSSGYRLTAAGRAHLAEAP